MNLTCEDLDPLDDVDPEQLEEILSSDAFDKFAILSQSESAFIQAASNWQPTDECAAFLNSNDSDPWIIEYRDGETGTHYRAEGNVTLGDVMRAFTSYLAGNSDWRTSLHWQPVAARLEERKQAARRVLAGEAANHARLVGTIRPRKHPQAAWTVTHFREPEVSLR
jgi:hypothetical protein